MKMRLTFLANNMIQKRFYERLCQLLGLYLKHHLEFQHMRAHYYEDAFSRTRHHQVISDFVFVCLGNRHAFLGSRYHQVISDFCICFPRHANCGNTGMRKKSQLLLFVFFFWNRQMQNPQLQALLLYLCLLLLLFWNIESLFKE